jgi:outer membrane protein assembly factor BamB
MQSGPIVVDGTIYLTTAEYTYAVDGMTCKLRWKHRYEYHPRPPFDPKVNPRVAYLDGRLFRGANDGRVYALDAASGQELWNVRAGEPERGETFPAAPVAWDGRVCSGNAGGDNLGVTGRMMAFEAATGGKLWSFDIVPGNGPAAATWPAETERMIRFAAATDFPGPVRRSGSGRSAPPIARVAGGSPPSKRKGDACAGATSLRRHWSPA